MSSRRHWQDLLDPTPAEISSAAGTELSARELGLLTGSGRVRPSLEGAGDHAVGVFAVAVAVPETESLSYQPVGLVLTSQRALTIRRTPEGGEPFDTTELAAACERPSVTPAAVALHLADIVAERYLDVIDALNGEIDVLEDEVERSLSAVGVHARLSELRHDILAIRQTLGSTRDAVHRVADGRLEGEAPGLVDEQAAARFGDVYDKLLRAADALELSRDLVAGVRDYHQAKIAQDQNEIVKRLTVVASLLLVPTFIVGVYGQNFDRLPELHWHYGYAFSWALIVLSTVAQLAFFRRRRWI